MNRLQFGALSALLALNVIAQFWPMFDRQRAHGDFEYMIESPPDETLLKEINASGAVGWELVSARRAIGEGKASYEMIYKRPK